MRDFQGATAFVTGGSSGIGLGIAKALAHEGAKVAFTYRRADHLEQAMAYFRAHRELQVHPIKLEVTDRAAMQTGKLVTAVANRTPSAARRSRFGVRMTELP